MVESSFETFNIARKADGTNEQIYSSASILNVKLMFTKFIVLIKVFYSVRACHSALIALVVEFLDVLRARMKSEKLQKM